MATINFLYRSTKDNAPLNVRLLFRHDKKDIVLGSKSELYIYTKSELLVDDKLNAKLYWSELHDKRKTKDIILRNKQVDIQQKLNTLENFILDTFEKADLTDIINNKHWLKNTLEEFYRPKKENSSIPSNLLAFFDYYISKKKNELSEGRIKSIKVTKNKLLKFENKTKQVIKISSINEDFKNDFTDFSNEHSYSLNTQHKDLKIIKTICRQARYLGIETHHQMEGIKLPSEAVKSIYLNLDELEILKNLSIKQAYLDNARDWLLISCFTGQRISDFMRFNKEMIRTENGKHLLEFKQTKTNKLMVIPLLKEVKEVLAKRNGEFPRAISDQKYNEFIKKVCSLAELNENCEGKKRISIADEGVKPTKNDYRDILGSFKKWELVSSHIGRRSFATNYYGKVATTFLINITGHSTEAMFLKYIKKSNKDLALESYDFFN